MPSNKRMAPVYIQSLLRFDKYISEEICQLSKRFEVTRSFARQGKTLEYTGHGLIWLCGWLLFIWFSWVKSLFQMQVNFFFGLILDILLVAVIKSIVRRRRPAGHKRDSIEIGPDKFSFPSGHVSRAFFVLFFFIYLYPVNIIFIPPLTAWAVSVAVSRILLKRHHLLDVLAGAVLGIFECFLLNFLWLSQGFTFYIVHTITDERFDGGEYHV